MIWIYNSRPNLHSITDIFATPNLPLSPLAWGDHATMFVGLCDRGLHCENDFATLCLHLPKSSRVLLVFFRGAVMRPRRVQRNLDKVALSEKSLSYSTIFSRGYPASWCNIRPNFCNASLNFHQSALYDEGRHAWIGKIQFPLHSCQIGTTLPIFWQTCRFLPLQSMIWWPELFQASVRIDHLTYYLPEWYLNACAAECYRSWSWAIPSQNTLPFLTTYYIMHGTCSALLTLHEQTYDISELRAWGKSLEALWRLPEQGYFPQSIACSLSHE